MREDFSTLSLGYRCPREVTHMKKAEQTATVAPAKRWSLGEYLRALPRFSKVLFAAGVALLLLGGGISVAESKKVDVPDLTGASVEKAIRIASDASLLAESIDSLPASDLRKFTAVTSQD